MTEEQIRAGPAKAVCVRFADALNHTTTLHFWWNLRILDLLDEMESAHSFHHSRSQPRGLSANGWHLRALGDEHDLSVTLGAWRRAHHFSMPRLQLSINEDSRATLAANGTKKIGQTNSSHFHSLSP